jgi:hypothetical protein
MRMDLQTLGNLATDEVIVRRPTPTYRVVSGRALPPRAFSVGKVAAATVAVALITGFGAHFFLDAQASETVNPKSMHEILAPTPEVKTKTMASAAYVDLTSATKLPKGLSSLTVSFDEGDKQFDLEPGTLTDILSVDGSEDSSIIAERVRVLEVRKYSPKVMISLAVKVGQVDAITSALLRKPSIFVPRGASQDGRFKEEKPEIGDLKVGSALAPEVKERIDYSEVKRNTLREVKINQEEWVVIGGKGKR